MADHIDLDVQFGIGYSVDSNNVVQYEVIHPNEATFSNQSSSTAYTPKDVSATTITTKISEGKKLNCRSVCNESSRARRYGCTGRVEFTSTDYPGFNIAINDDC